MILVEQHIISKHNENYKIVDNLCFKSKNLYNSALYVVKQEYLKSGRLLRYSDLEKYFRENNSIDYFAISTSVSQQILRLFDKNIKSYFSLLKMWKKSKTSLNGCPKFPKYKDKVKGRNIFV
jgi:putative transposase